MLSRFSKIRIIIYLLLADFIYGLTSHYYEMASFYEMIQKEYPDKQESFTHFYLGLNWETHFYAALMIFYFLSIFIFIKYRHQKSSFLSVILLFNLLSEIVSLPIFFYQNLFVENPFNIKILVSIISFAFKIYVLIYLQNQVKAKFEINKDGDITFYETPKSYRFAHRLVDYLITIFLLYLCLTNYESYFFKSSALRFKEAWDYIFFLESRFFFHMAFVSLFYYIFCEVVFNTTIGKIIFGNVIINNSAETPSFFQRVGRSFCRQIPFEAISFFFNSGWHDRLTQTYVVKADKSRRKKTN